MIKDFERILGRVSKPSRYINHEFNSIHKDPEKVRVKFGLAYPDVYEVGLPHLGLQILYELLNAREDTLAERVYAPWLDMEEEMRSRRFPLFSLESHFPLSAFDFLGFTLQYELTYTNILNMLDLAGIPILAEERNLEHPVVIAGGPGAYNAEPLAPFLDLVVIGDGEEVINQIVDVFILLRKQAKTRAELLKYFAKIKGVYLLKEYAAEYDSQGRVSAVFPRTPEVPPTIEKRVVEDLDLFPIPKPPVPFVNVVHDRCSVEIMRGCARGCRFCQAGIIYRPVRERTPGKVVDSVSRVVKENGYEEVSLASLSSTDYSGITELLQGLTPLQENKKVAVSLPSLRIDAFSVELAQEIQRVRKSGLTFAPEAGTQRLRDAINKRVTASDMMETARCAFGAGWFRLKLYFMIGLPTENQEDLQGIVDMVREVVQLGRKMVPSEKRHLLNITVNVASFVPKAHTPFQWVGQDSLDRLEEKQNFLKRNLKGRHISLKWHDAKMSKVEAVIARGDRRMSGAIYDAWKSGCKFDGWSDYFEFEKWQQAVKNRGLSMEFFAERQRDLSETLPWDHITTGVTKKFLAEEYSRALSGITTPDCRWETCYDCGVCTYFHVNNKVVGLNV
jgi:radical SAM family uncharacterized protein